MKEQLKNEIQAARKAKFNLNTISTIEVFSKVISAYKKLLLEAERDLHDYTIDVTLCDLSGFNKLGAIEELCEKQGDIFFIDLNNSAFVPDFVNEEGDIESGESICFSKVEDLKEIKDIQFSLKEWIELCEKENIGLKIFAKADYDHNTGIEMNINRIFDKDNEQIQLYLNSVNK